MIIRTYVRIVKWYNVIIREGESFMHVSEFFTTFNIVNHLIGISIGVLLSIMFYKLIFKLHLYMSFILGKSVKVTLVEGYIEDRFIHRKRFSFAYTGREYPFEIIEVPMNFTYSVKGKIDSDLDLKSAIKNHYTRKEKVKLESPRHRVMITNKASKDLIYRKEVDIDMDAE